MRLIPVLALALWTSCAVYSQEADLEESMLRGKDIYMDFCVTCHLENGEGVANTFPPLAQSDYLAQNRTASIRGVKYGQQGEIVVNGVTYNNAMPSMGLEPEEIADVMNYIMNSWGNWSDKLVTTDEVKAVAE
ncbi:c-type cytochrome [Pseudozobellia thermophila]|uniref:Cytochrome c, mono-and diheme variants n=1 Tax=Pseudozobellia thermophila TaxID=192903 RepID=A0A1M6IZ25_9FLAO|nr:cytochrome c [Pseudozobellia thermophila]SHJ39706.1 Cytochrome c, mono-and diheme variants [Pseudozobellia thermophila]